MFYSIFNYNFFEYFSEEILIFLVSVLFGFIITLCWQSTAPSPLNYNLWLVQIVQSTPQHRILRIVSMTDQFYDSSNPPPPTPSSSEENNAEEGEITNLLVIQTPNSVEQNIPSTQMSIQSAENTTTNPTAQENEFSTNSNQNGQDLPSSPNGTPQNHQENQQPEIMDASQLLTIRLKFLDDSQKLVQSTKNTSIGTFKRQHFSEHLAAGKIIRLIFQGRLLRDDRSTLDACGLKDQCVVHCHIGNRPYSSTGQQTPTDGTNQPQPQMENTNENTNNNMNMPQIGARMTTTIGTVMNLLFMGGTYLIMVAWQWANTTQQVPPAENQTILARSVEYFRSGVRILLDMLFGSFVRSRNGQRRDDEDLYRFNVGQLLALLIFVKFMLLWMFVLLYPQFTDRRSLFLLTMLTGTTGLYFYFNRATSTATTNQNQQNNSRRMAE